MKKQRARNSAKLNSPQGRRPEGRGLASDSQNHGLPSVTRPYRIGRCAPLRSRQSHRPQAEDAKAYAFLLLKFRLRSEKELALRLRQKKFPEKTIQDTISFLKDKQFIDDRLFAKGWVSSRLKRPFGLRRIRQELALKGLDKEVIEEALEQVKGDYSENEVISQLAEQRFSKLKNIEPQKAKARVYAYLMRRGFSPEITSDIVRGL